jgi:hypothetical protein
LLLIFLRTLCGVNYEYYPLCYLKANLLHVTGNSFRLVRGAKLNFSVTHNANSEWIEAVGIMPVKCLSLFSRTEQLSLIGVLQWEAVFWREFCKFCMCLCVCVFVNE